MSPTFGLYPDQKNLRSSHGQFVCELVDARLPVSQLPFLLTHLALFLLDLDDQLRRQRAKLFRAEGGEIGG
jgi:hypothetical protein